MKKDGKKHIKTDTKEKDGKKHIKTDAKGKDKDNIFSNAYNISDQTRALKESSIGDDFEFSKIIYFCKDCKKIVDVIPRRSMKFRCKECKSINIAFGTERSIRNYYKIPPDKLESIE